MRYSINLRYFAQRAFITFGGIANVLKKQADNFFIFLRKLFPGDLFCTIYTELTYKIVIQLRLGMLKTQRLMQICQRNL
jgi:hypothetical protein